MLFRNLNSLEQKLGYSFQDKGLLRHALTHGSAAEARNPLKSYQRLEFLGDRVLGLTIAALVYAHYPKAHEGELSRRLTSLVRKEACTKVGHEIGLGQYIILGVGEAQSGGRQKATILADVVEAVIGAIFYEAGFQTAQDCVARLWAKQLTDEPKSLRDHKTSLQEWAHQNGFSNPSYKVMNREGPDHEPLFTIGVTVLKDGEPHTAEGQGSSKRIGEQNAAKSLKARLSTPTNI